jgi:hypothetical protein
MSVTQQCKLFGAPRNNIPVQNWLVFHRQGTRVKIQYGKDNIDAYGVSKQKRFIQLINDPFYKGIE